VKEQVKSQVTEEYKTGSITRNEAEELLKQYWDTEATKNDQFWIFDRINYKKETGMDAGSGAYYRFIDAFNANSVEQLRKAVKELMDHGYDQKKIKDRTSDWKKEYLAADKDGRRRILDAMQKTYRIIGLTADDATKKVETWIKEEKKKK
jgi:hypothetical protein